MPGRLQHDCAFTIALRTLELIRGLIREEEQRDFVEEAYAVALQEIDRLLEAAARQEARLRPLGQKGKE